MKKMLTAFVVAGFVISTPNGFARNPLKVPPSDSGSPGSGDPGSVAHSDNTLTLTNYQAVCQSRGKVSIGVQSMTVNGHRQMFLHTEAQESSAEDENAALAYVYKGSSAFLNIPVQNPISFQLIGGQTELVTVTYAMGHGAATTTIFVTPDSPFRAGNFAVLTNNGHGNYSVPIGTGHGSIPKGATLNFLLFQTICKDLCTTYTADLNNLRINGASVGIKTDSKSCGGDCTE